MALRAQNAALLLAIESEEGTFQAPSSSTDGIRVEGGLPELTPDTEDTEEVSGSLDASEPLIGGMRVSIPVGIYLKGSGLPYAAPEWGDLLKICALSETITSTSISGTGIAAVASGAHFTDSGNGLAALTSGTAIYVSGWALAANNGEFLVATSAAGDITVTKPDGSAAGLVNESAGATITIRRGIAAVAATAGSTTGFTAQSPWGNTAQLYRFMPVLLSGNPATPYYSAIQDYTAARVAAVTDLMGVALDTSTKVSIPPNVLYVPATSSIPSASAEYYCDGVRYRFAGVRGQIRALTWTAAKTIKLDAVLTGMFVSESDAAVPTPSYDGTSKGVWRGSKMLLNRRRIALNSFVLADNMQLENPANPNADEGFDPAIHTGRRWTMTLDPLKSLSATQSALAALRDGTRWPVHSLMRGGAAAGAGQRLALTGPDVKFRRVTPGNRNRLVTDQIEGQPLGNDSGFGLAIY